MMPVITPLPKSDAAFLQALFEGMDAIEASCSNEIKVRGGPAITQLFTAGGGAKNDKWTAIRARFLNQEPSIPEFYEATVGVEILASEKEKFYNASGGRIKRKLY
jgi:D-ribulokinase